MNRLLDGYKTMRATLALCIFATVASAQPVRVRAKLEPEVSTVKMGNTVEVKITLQNLSSENLQIGFEASKGFDLVIFDTVGRRLDGTIQAKPDKEQPRGGDDIPEMITTLPRSFQLKAGQTIVQTRVLLAGRDFPKPGTYLIELQLGGHTVGNLVKSNRIRVIVAD